MIEPAPCISCVLRRGGGLVAEEEHKLSSLWWQCGTCHLLPESQQKWQSRTLAWAQEPLPCRTSQYRQLWWKHLFPTPSPSLSAGDHAEPRVSCGQSHFPRNWLRANCVKAVKSWSPPECWGADITCKVVVLWAGVLKLEEPSTDHLFVSFLLVSFVSIFLCLAFKNYFLLLFPSSCLSVDALDSGKPEHWKGRTLCLP